MSQRYIITSFKSGQQRAKAFSTIKPTFLDGEAKKSWVSKNVSNLLILHHPVFFKRPSSDEESNLQVSYVNPTPVMLRNVIGSTELKLSEQHISIIMRNLFCGLQHLHSRTFSLVDINPDTIVVKQDSDQNFAVFFSDISSAVMMRDINSTDLQNAYETDVYHAPEVHNNHVVTHTSDVYSLGLVWICLTSNSFIENWNCECPLEINTRAIGHANEVQKLILDVNPNVRMPLNWFLPKYLSMAQLPEISDLQGSPVGQIFETMGIRQYTEMLKICENELAAPEPTQAIISAMAVVINKICNEINFVQSSFQTFLINDVITPFVAILITLHQKHLLQNILTRLTLDQDKILLLCALGLGLNEDLIDVVELFVNNGVLILDKNALIKFINMELPGHLVKRLIDKSDQEEWKTLVNTFWTNGQRQLEILETKNRELQDENRTLKRKHQAILQTLQTDN
jgi:serine/threonine protein kinase